MASPALPELYIQLPSGAAAYRLRRSQRAKRLLLKVDIRHGIEVVIPRRMSVQAAKEIVWRHRHWLQRTITKQQKMSDQLQLMKRSYRTGETLPLLGENLLLQVNRTPRHRRVRIRTQPGQLVITAPMNTAIRPALIRWYRRQARDYFLTASTQAARQLKVTFTRVTIGEQKTKWGSCSARGRLSYNWRLLLAPRAIAAYVVAHEVAHVRHRHHAHKFWQTVAQLDPDYQAHRAWLKKNGYTLSL